MEGSVSDGGAEEGMKESHGVPSRMRNLLPQVDGIRVRGTGNAEALSAAGFFEAEHEFVKVRREGVDQNTPNEIGSDLPDKKLEGSPVSLHTRNIGK